VHASPAFQITVRCFGVWRVACAGLVLAAAASMGLWVHRAFESSAVWVWLTLALFMAASVALIAHAWRLRPMSLRWDTQRWHWGAAATTGQEPHAGHMTVSMDLGGWLLLHLTPDEAGLLHRGAWVPVQRRGHEAAWHALRCTVYCARPASLPTAAPF
jgi:hypothetical protein